MESWLQSWRPRTNAFCIFSSPCLWSIAPATTKWCQVIQSVPPVTQNHLPENLMLQNATPLRKSAPWPPNISDEHVSCTAPATENASFQILFKRPTPAIVFGHARKPHVLLIFDKVHNPLRQRRKTTSERPKVLRTRQFLTLLTSKCASCHNGMHCFDISTSKSRPNMRRFVFWLPHVLRATMACTFSTSQLPKVPRPWCALYILTSTCASRHNGVHFFDITTSKSRPNMRRFVFWLPHVLRATMACTFSTSQLPKVLRPWCALDILTWASRHNGVHFFDVTTSKSAPTLVCFAHFDLETCFAPQRRALFRHLNFQKPSGHEVFCTFWLPHVLRATTACNCSSLIWPHGSTPAALASLLFDPPEPQIIGKTQCFAALLPFRVPASSFFSLFLFSDLTSAFPSVHIVGSLTSKLPSIRVWLYK